ncbi:hypothetical protein JCM3770_007470 [Rhodotorula araucariae]
MRSLAFATATSLALASLASGFTYSVGVGKNESTGQPGVGFDPSRTVITNPGSNEIVFQFLAGVHRVVQVTPAAPCAPGGDFDTGVQRVQAGTLQGAGPNATFNIANNSEVLYFADIGDDYSPCYLGAVFCVNTDESSASDTSCHSVIAAAKALGKQYGVTTTPPAPGATSTSAAVNGTSSTSSSSATSAASSSSSPSSSASAGVSRTASGSAAQASRSAGGGSSGASASLQVAAGAAALVGGAAALLL